MPKYVNVITDQIDKLAAAPFVIEADAAEVEANELWVKLGDVVVARFPERSVRRWWIEDGTST